MKKLLLSFFSLLLVSICFGANFGIWASAIRLNVNGTPAFYNTKNLLGPSAIGTNNFGGFLGAFGNNSNTLIIQGAAIKTFRGNGTSICNAVMYYAIYPAGKRPDSPLFTSLSLSPSCNCSNNSFDNCNNGGPCNSATNDQVWQTLNHTIDLTLNATGDYTLEIYYQLNGDVGTPAGCTQRRTDNNDGSQQNYHVDFSIVAPLAISFTTLNGTSTESSVKVRWVLQKDDDILKYEIQKSDNGLNFSPIDSIAAKRSTTVCNYAYNDYAPIIGSNYYRIKIYNANNTISLTKVIRIYFGKVGNTIFIYPNPSGSELAVRFAAVDKGNYQMSVISIDGKRITTEKVYHDGIDKTMKIQLPRVLQHGVYQLFLIDKIQFYKQSFLVK